MTDLDEGRKDQIVAGVILVQSLLERLKGLGLEKLSICNAALREGILLDYVQRKLPAMRIRREVPDPRRRSVLDLCRRCEWHKEHSEQVTALTLRLFEELRGLHHLGPIDRELLEYAALMHDIGWHIGRKAHHKHSAYLILHGKLRDFTEEEVLIMANIARYHRGPEPGKSHRLHQKLSRRARKVVDAGAAMLRVADGLDRSHAAVIRDLSCEVQPGKVKVVLEARSDAELELWGARRKAELFERVFERSIDFTLG
jgi:exopolyphosphatase/guanosine-5'-triphosphate,3'-diphosphate pyrophosphatase